MAAQVFSITQTDGSTITGNQVEGRIIKSFLDADYIQKYGFMYADNVENTSVGPKQVVRIPSGKRVIGDNYTFSANDSGIAPDTLEADVLLVEINKTASALITSEGLDSGLWSSVGKIRENAITTMGRAVANTIAVDFLTMLDTTLKANPTQVVQLPAIPNTITASTATLVVKQLEEFIRNYRQTITSYREMLPDDQIRLLASYEYIDLYAKCLGVLGLKPVYVESKYVQEATALRVNGMELLPFKYLRQNLTAGLMHKTKAIDMSNYHIIALSLPSVAVVKGNVQMWQSKSPKSNNPLNGVKGVYGMAVNPVFKTDIYGIVQQKAR